MVRNMRLKFVPIFPFTFTILSVMYREALSITASSGGDAEAVITAKTVLLRSSLATIERLCFSPGDNFSTLSQSKDWN